jgi:hypothetical protein
VDLIIGLILYLVVEAIFPSEPHEYKKRNRETKDLFVTDEFTDLFK